MAGKISELTNMSGSASIDRAADFLEIVDNSGPTSYKATPNFILGITGNPIGTTDTQVMTNKTLTSPTLTTPTMTINDDSLSIRDNSDTTKVMQFQLSGITTGTTRTLTVPDASGTVVLTGATQTLTNKTLSAPTISNPTLTVDTISEFTAANGVSIDGLLIKDGLLPAGNIQPLNLVSGTGSSWVWQSYTPSWTNLVIGSSTVVAKYIQIGKIVHVNVSVTLAGGNFPSGTLSMSLPVTSITGYIATMPIGIASFADVGTNLFLGHVHWETTTTVNLRAMLASGTYASDFQLTGAAPYGWANGDIITADFTYEAA